jgi:hypothetical protein
MRYAGKKSEKLQPVKRLLVQRSHMVLRVAVLVDKSPTVKGRRGIQEERTSNAEQRIVVRMPEGEESDVPRNTDHCPEDAVAMIAHSLRI